MPGIARSYSEEIYKTYSSAKHRLGAIIEFPDGRVFRFGQAGAVALAHGKLHQSALPIADHTNVAVSANAAIGALQVSATLGATAAAKDLYKDGFLLVNDATGEGYAYRIKGHAAADASGVITVQLYEDSPVKVALVASTSEVTLVHNRFKNCLIHPSPPTAQLAGVAIADIAIGAYGWFQTKGPAPVLVQGTVVIGDLCVPSATVDGAVMPSAALETDGPVVGIVVRVLADTEYGIVDLNLP